MTNFTPGKQLLIIITSIFFLCLNSCNQQTKPKSRKDGYDEPAKAAMYERLRTHDPVTGEIPSEKMWQAITQTKLQKDQLNSSSNIVSALTWEERGSNSDAIGPSNGNTRANSGVTSGRIDALWVDIADATGNTVWVGGRGGGIWKTTNISSSPATWTPVNDYMVNLSIMAITQDPTDANIMYCCTGESFYESGALRGNGVFKSTDHGVTWSQLSSTNNASYYFCTRILCDYQGNIYVGTRSGLFRSTKASGGAVWTNITPSGVNIEVSDLDISSTSGAGRLHAIFGLSTGLTSRYTDIPATVVAGTWTSPATVLPATSIRAELAVSGNTLYCLPSNGSYQTPSVYKSTDGGANWAIIGATPTTATGDPFANGQGWYNLAVAINPSNASECIIGGIDNAKTTNGGTTWTRISDWVGTSGQYVHADQHASIWYDNGNKLLFGCDGGIFYSSNGGTTTRDRNVGLRLKEFYSVAVHPSTTNYFLTGAQDNGTHQFSNAGLSSSVEVFGGDGAYVAIDQDEPQYQIGSYVYSNYRRSTNSGATWSFGGNNNNGLFINPFDYDNLNDRVYASYTGGNFLRWEDPQAGFTYTTVPLAAFGGQLVGAVHVSPFTANRVYFGMANGGKIIRVDGANGAGPTGVDITGAGMPTGSVFMNCINTGSSDQFLVACYSNYGTNNVWVTSNGGTAWTNIDGNLPNMPVYWALYHPDNNDKMILATETGIWETDDINGASTVWTPNTSFPTARATQLKYRSSDRTLAASSYGRGLWTTIIPSVTTPDIQFTSATASATEATAFTSGCRGYTDYSFTMQILNAPTGNATVTLNVAGGATATALVDYVVTTNGNFVTPSNVLSFASGAATPQSFTIRVYDDAAIEAAENFTLNYTISGATNAQAGTTNQTFVFTINDNDAAPVISSSLLQTWGLANVAAVASGPFNGSAYTDKRIQNLYLASDLIAAGFSAGSITDFAWNFNSTTIATFNNFTISIGFTNTTDLATGFVAPAPTFTTVYAGNFVTPGVTGWRNFVLPTPVNWDGTSNVVIEVCFDNTVITSDIAVLGTTVGGYTPSALVRQNAAGTLCASAASNTSATRPDIRLGLTIPGNAVSTVLNSSKTAYLGPFDDVYFYDATGNIMARIRNLGAFDYGCTQVIIDRAGTASVPFWNNNPANYLASKTFRVIPTNNTTTGNYQISLYYTATERNNWMALTGQLFSSAQVIKVSNGFYIPDVTPATTHVSDVMLSPNTAGTFGTHYIATGDFSSTGFSGFGIGVAGFALPIHINYFTGTRQATNHLLNWKVNCSTSDRATMILERSIDSRNYKTINAITADALRCMQPFDFTDKNPLPGINYYRLKVIDVDGKITYSSIVALLNAVKGVEVISLSPNPAVGNNVNLNITSATPVKADLQITDMQGRTVKRFAVQLTGGFNTIPLDVKNLAAGTYNISGIAAGENLKLMRFVKQ